MRLDIILKLIFDWVKVFAQFSNLLKNFILNDVFLIISLTVCETSL